MQKSFKKTIAIFLVVLMLMTSVPLNGFVGMDWSFSASAAEENVISSLDDIINKENEKDLSDFQNKFEEDKADFSEFAEKVKDEAENVFSLLAEKKAEQAPSASLFSLRSVVPVSEETDFSWEYDEETRTLIVRGTGDMPDYTEMMEQEGVPTPIAPWAEYAKEIEKVVIEAGITSVGDCAFALCTNLKEVVLPEGITSIGAGAFAYCVELVDINLPSTLISVDQMAFSMCWSVKELVLPDSIETIGDMAFMYMSDLEKINLPASLQDNGEGMFTYALSLKELVVPEGLKIESVYDVTEFFALSLEHITNHSATFAVDISFGDLLDGYFDSIEYANAFSCLYKNYFKYEFTGEEAAMSGIEISEQELIEDTINYFNTNLGTNYAVADFESFEHVLAIVEETIYVHIINGDGYPSYFSVSCLEDSKQHELCRDNAISHDIIGEEENCVCFVMNGTIGDNITWFVDAETKTLTFDGLGEMTDFDDVPDYVKYSAYIENISFAEGSDVTSIGDYAFYGLTNVETITLPEGITALGEYCFYNSGVKILNLPASLNSTDMLSFYTGTAPLEEINVAEGNEKFLSYEGSLYLEYVEYEGEMTYLLLKQPEKHADVFIDNTIGFFYCAFEHYSTVKQINVPDTVLMMTEAAFLACASLETINIGNSKIYQADGETASLEIEDDFVAYCNNLTAINVDEKNINYSSIDGVLYNKNVTEIITVPMGLNEVTVPETVIAIPRYAFDYDKLKKVTILNPDCEIRDESSAIYRNATICGYKDSTAEAYADKYNRNFEYIGDVTVVDVEFDFSEVKKVYGQFSDIDTSGIKVTLTFSDGTTSVKTSGFNVTGFDSNDKGEQLLTVTYRSYSDIYTVTVGDPFFTDIGEYLSITIDPGETLLVGFTPEETKSLELNKSSYTSNTEYYVTIYEEDKQTIIYSGILDSGNSAPIYKYEAGKTYYFAFSHNRFDDAHLCVGLEIGHNYYVSDSQNVTCTQDGYTTYTCTDCGYVYTEYIYSPGHIDNDENGRCDVCDYVIFIILDKGIKNSFLPELYTDYNFKFTPETSEYYEFSFGVDCGLSYWCSLYDQNGNNIELNDRFANGSFCNFGAYLEKGKTYKYTVYISDFDGTSEFNFVVDSISDTELVMDESVDFLASEETTFCNFIPSRSDNYVFEFGCDGWREFNIYNRNLTVIETITINNDDDVIFADASMEAGKLYYIGAEGSSYESKIRVVGPHFDDDNDNYCDDCDISMTEIIASGTHGSNIVWNLKANGEMNLQGSGEMINGTIAKGLSPLVKSVIIDKNITTIGDEAFSGSSALKKVIFEEGSKLTSIGTSAFAYSNLSEITIPEGVESIGNYCFMATSIERINIPGTLVSMGYESFALCIKLKEYDVHPNNTICKDIDGVLFSKDGTVLYAYPSGKKDKKYIMPDSVIEIAPEAFYMTILETVKISKNIAEINSYCFMYNFALKDLIIPEGVNTIGESAIYFSANNVIVINENCIIEEGALFPVYYDSDDGFDWDEPNLDSDKLVVGKVSGYVGSTAEDYANSTDGALAFEALDVTKIEILELPKTEYMEVDMFTTEGLKLLVTYNNDSFTAERTFNFTAKGFNRTNYGINEITVTHDDCQTSYEITINEVPEISIGQKIDVSEANKSGWIKFVPEINNNYKVVYNTESDTEIDFTYSFYDVSLEEGFDEQIKSKQAVFEEGKLYYIRYDFTNEEIPDDLSMEIICTEEHNFGNWKVTTPPTCVLAGEETGYCSICNIVTKREVKELGHDYSEEWTVDKEATCTKDGSKSHHCSRCDDKSDVTVIEKLGHAYGEWVVTTQPTCTKTGVEKRTCSRCGNVESQVVEALGHDYSNEWTVDKEATCTEDGSKSHHCIRCDDKADITVIEKLGHTYSEWVVTIEPTCTKTGVEKRTCSRCGNVESQVVDALGHDYSEEWTVDKEATCTIDGSKSHHCTRCDDKTDVTVIEAHGHEYESVITEPTCTKDGYTTHTCSICEDTYTDTVVDALGHTYSEWVVTTEPNCTKTGVEKRTCSRCDNVESQTVDALGHDYSKEWTIDKEATCTEDGSKSHHCTRCDDKADVTVIEKHGHAYGEWVVTTEPTCIKTGVEKRTCSRCDNIESQTVEALGHDYSEEWTVDKESTCTEDGSKSHHCTRCDDKADVTALPKGEHKYKAFEVVYPTCTAQGYTKYRCSICKEVKSDDYEDAVGHSFGEWFKVNDPDCVNKGKSGHTCTVCNTTEYSYIDSLGHNWSKWSVSVEPTVLADGKETRNCSRCNKVETKTISRIEVDIAENENYGLAHFTVVDAQTLEPIEGASIFISTENDGENTFFTNEEGKVSIVLPVGKQTIQTYAEGCHVRSLKVTINPGEQTLPNIGLSGDELVDAEVTVEEMTLEEILEAGIDVNAEDNKQYYKWSFTCKFDAVPEFIFEYVTDSEGNTYYTNNDTNKKGPGYSIVVTSEGEISSRNSQSTNVGVRPVVNLGLTGYSKGDKFNFGYYPQTQVISESLIDSLNSQDIDWEVYEVYCGDGEDVDSSVITEIMYYADVEYNGSTYRAIKNTEYRPAITYTKANEYNSYQDNNGYYTDNVYWFKYEPISWIVLEQNADSVFVISENALDSQSRTVYKQDFELKEWLNNEFALTAFTAEERGKIVTTKVSNCWCGEHSFTYEKLYFISEKDVSLEDYGFQKYNEENLLVPNYEMLCAKGTDYSLALGIYDDTWEKNEFEAWWIRGLGEPSGGGGGGGGGFGGGGGGFRGTGGNGTPFTIYPMGGGEEELFYLVIWGEVSWLKEMFDVEMVVINRSKTDTIENCVATLDIPDGLSLATMVGEQQTLAQNIGHIDSDSTETVHWYIRGDKEGNYNVKAKLEGTLMPFEEDFCYDYEAKDSVRVYAGSAMHMTFTIPDGAYEGHDAVVTIELENVSDKTLYNVSSKITDVFQFDSYYLQGDEGGLYYHTKGGEKVPWESGYAEKFEPGDKIVLEVSTNILFHSRMYDKLAVEIGKIEKLKKMYDSLQALIDVSSGFIGLLDLASKNIDKVISEGAEIAGECYSALASEISKLYTKLDGMPESEVAQIAVTLINSDVWGVIEGISSGDWTPNMNDAETIIKTADKIKTIVEEKEDYDDPFGLIQDVISLLPVRYRLIDAYVETRDGSTTEIPYTIETYHVESPYKGVINMGKIMMDTVITGMGEIDTGMFKIFGISDPTGFKDSYNSLKTELGKLKALRVRAGVEDTRVKAWVVPAKAKTRSASLNAEDFFTLSITENDTAEIVNGVLEFTGNATLNVTALSEVGGTLYVDMGDGDVFEYEIEVVEEHECSSEEWVTLLSASKYSDSYQARYCDICDELIDYRSVEACKNHDFGAWTTESEANCTVGGVATRTCSSCGYEETSFIDATGHTEKTINKVDATCTADGYTGDVICEVCEETISVGEAVEANGHSYEAVITAPTCTVDGYTTNTCSVCQDSYISDKTEKLGHIGGTANCEDKAICTVCGEAYGEINPDNHKNVVTDKAVSATCTSTGLTEGSHCDACSKVIVAQTTIAKISHKEMIIPAVNATCSKTGLTEGKKCSVCGEILVKQTETSKLEHSYKSVVTAPTCTNGGYTTYTCSVCKHAYKANETAKLGHNMGSFIVVEQPSCTENGLEIAECSRCDYSEVNELSASGHNYQDGVCTECGDSKSNNCSCNCHKTGFMGFIWKILRFFYKLFGMNKVCSCGVAHY